jgi:hypothetical protein
MEFPRLRLPTGRSVYSLPHRYPIVERSKRPVDDSQPLVSVVIRSLHCWGIKDELLNEHGFDLNMA